MQITGYRVDYTGRWVFTLYSGISRIHPQGGIRRKGSACEVRHSKDYNRSVHLGCKRSGIVEAHALAGNVWNEVVEAVQYEQAGRTGKLSSQ